MVEIIYNPKNMEIKETSKRKRLINFIVDLIALILLTELTIWIEDKIEFKSITQFSRIITWLGGYYIPLEFFSGKTIGKYITKTKVVNRKGEKIDLRQAVIRYMCRWIPFEFASLTLGHDARAWHDLISNTYVIDEEEINDIKILDDNQF